MIRVIPGRSLMAAVFLAGVAVSAHASFTNYTTQAAFGAATSVRGVDTFSDLAAGPLGASLTRNAGAISYSVSALNGLYGMTQGAGLSIDDRRDTLTFTNFSSAFNSIGASFFGTNEGGSALANQSIWVTITDSSLAQSTTLLTSNSASSFFGVASTLTIVAMTVSVDSQNLLAAWPTVDNLTVAAAVPEPSTWVLLGFGLAAVAVAARRRAAGAR